MGKSYWFSMSAMKGRSVSLHGRSVRPALQNAWWSCWTAHYNLLQMDAKFDALEDLFIQIYGRGQISSINQVRKTIFCQRNQNVEMIPPSQNALFQHYWRAMFKGLCRMKMLPVMILARYN